MESESNSSIYQNPNPNSLEFAKEDHLKSLAINAAAEEEEVVNSEKRSEDVLNGSMNSNCNERVPTSENEEQVACDSNNEGYREGVIGSMNSVEREEELIVEKELQRDSTIGSVGTDVFEEVGESFSPSADFNEREESKNEEEISNNLMSEVVRESSTSDVVRRENSEIEFDAQSNPSSSGYVGERGSSSASTVSDEIEEVEEDGNFDNGMLAQQNDNSSNGVYDSASWVPGKRHDEEDDTSISWRKRKKHFFVLSHSGKPIYSRYGDEHKLAGFSATLQAIISFVENGGDRVKFVRAGKHQVVFLVKGPIYLVCISCTEEPHEALTGQLELLYGQLLLILTKSVNRCFEKNSKFDMTPLLGGTDVVFSSLIHSFSWNPAAFLHAYTCLPLAYPTRQAAGAILQDVADSGVLFAILMCKHKVLSLVGAQKASLHPDDMLLLANFVLSSESFRTSESFSPICLPRYNPMAFLYAYIHYLDVDTYLILLTTSSDAFFHLKDCRLRIELVLLKSNVLSEVQKSILEGGLHVEDLPVDPSSRTGYLSTHLGHDRSGTESPIRSREVNPGIGGPAGLWHFIYRSINLDQYVSSEFSPPINTSRQQKRLYRAYQKLYASMHDRGIGPNKTQFRRDEDYGMKSIS
ncbi:hypothetical protein AQUCO_02700261v1 [Aquilegia coerulea]|uniref:Vacuolar fusion protein MON1 homolog n=1 Tax=Aquilegia coerulea TaxID=218851 RepID=A0A2G5D612_AQUCA|nr:hypothetical protein AQUCO_02700261v1 [Aquilegia coerulea]